LYGPGEVAEHAAIVARRGASLVHAERWLSPQGPQLCVVAEDRPGLLALVTDALLAQGMGVQAARAFCRVVGKDRLEAVDFLQLHSLGSPKGALAQLDDEALPAFVRALSELISDHAAERAPESTAAWSSSQSSAVTRVYFEREPPSEGRYLLVVESADSDGLLHAVSSTLHAHALRIMACEIRTIDGRAHDRFEVEPVAPRFLKDSELCDVQLAVLEALPASR